jgi:hypothetical protein
LSALPRDQQPIPVEEEYKAIYNAKDRSRYREQINLVPWPAVSLEEFQGVFEKNKPNILHFSGHATEIGSLVFQGPDERTQYVPKEPFTKAFELLGEKNLKLVVLSVCFSKQQAESVVQYVDRVVGFDQTIEADKAIMFFEKFYESIFNEGNSVEEAFKIAKNQLSLNKKEGESNPNPIILNSSRNSTPLYLIQTPKKQLNDYLNRIYKETSRSIEAPDFPLEHPPAYIDHRKGRLLLIKKDWNLEYPKLEIGAENNVMNAEEIVYDFLASEERTYLVIGAPFGVGKSSLVKKVTHDLVEKVRNGNTDTYVPILISDTNTMNNYYNGKSVEELIQNIVPSYDSHKKILIVFDGVDQYNEGSKALIARTRSEDFKKYDNRKIILTTRLNPEFPAEYEPTESETYLRLLPFSVSQVNEYFRMLETDLTYQKAIDLGIGDEDIRKPFLPFILSSVYRHNQGDLLRLKDLTSNESRAFIYLDFIHRLIGKYQEKRTLRRIALLMKLFMEKLSEKILLDRKSVFTELFEFDEEEDPINRLRQILRDYFDIILSSSRSKERRVLFLHSTFKEYLMAETYIEILMLGKNDDILSPNWMNITIPTAESVQFLEGLLGLIKKRGESETIKKWIDINDQNEGSLFTSFKQGSWMKKDALINLLTNSSDIIEDDTVSLLISDVDKSENKRHRYFVNGGISFKIGGKTEDTSINEYKNLWIHKWITLFILKKLSPDTKIDKRKLITLIKSSSNLVPEYVKNLMKVDLSEAELKLADLSGADLSWADLSRANLSYAFLLRADLSHANLSNAFLSRADLSGADLTFANLSSANLTSTNLHYVNLSGADLSAADLNGADFFQSIVVGVTLKYDDLRVNRRTSFKDSITDDQKFASELEKTNLQKQLLPHLCCTKEEIRKELEKRPKYNQSQIEHILSLTKAP